MLQVDGKPVAGVEVWLGVTQPGIGSEARYVCSDDGGVVEFDEVPFDASLTSIAGPGTAGACPNPLFLDTSSSPAYPLTPTTLLTANSSISDSRDLGVVAVPRLPGSAAIARESTAFYVSCFRDGDIDEARRHLESYDRVVAVEESTVALTFREMELIQANTNVLRFLNDLPEPCTEVTTVEQVPLLFDWAYTAGADRPQLTVIDPGAEPRRVLAFTPQEGTMSDTTQRQVISVTQSIDGEATISTTTELDLAQRTEVVAADEEGFVVTSTIHDFRVNSDDEIAQAGTQAALRELIGILEARLIAPTGEVLATDLAGFDFLGSATTALSYVLPTEPVGVGASWTVNSSFEVLGADANASTTYTIVDLDGARLTLDITTMHDIDVEAFVESLGLEGADVSLTQSGSGRAVWDLTTIDAVESDFELQQLLAATATFGDQTSTLKQTTASSITIPSPAEFPVVATDGSTTTVQSQRDEPDETDSCVSMLWDEISDEPAVIRQLADYEALRAEGVNVDAFLEDFGPELRGIVLPSAVMSEVKFREPVSIPIDTMACYVGDPIKGPEFVRLKSNDPISSLPEPASQENDLVLFPGDAASAANPVEVDVFGELVVRGVIIGTSLTLDNQNMPATGIGVVPAGSGFVLVVVWAPTEGSTADAAALMNDTIHDAAENAAHADVLDLLAADVVEDSGMIVATIPLKDRQLGIWRDLTAIFDPLVFPRPSD